MNNIDLSLRMLKRWRLHEKHDVFFYGFPSIFCHNEMRFIAILNAQALYVLHIRFSVAECVGF